MIKTMTTNKQKSETRLRNKHSHGENRFAVIPTALRLRADENTTGKGITIAMIDAGFFPHPDLTKPVNRILAFHDVTAPDSTLNPKKSPEAWDWHGTQTSVSAAGNGFLSDGIYHGLAPDANVVLVKVSERGRITEENIARGLEWVLKHKDLYNIRIASISLGGDQDVPYQQNVVDQLAEEAVRQGIVIVVAAGNSGCTDRHHTVPPANSPSVITVGGYDDQNQLNNMELHLYCSSFGPTADGLIKPEICAPAMWVAAPILPRTEFYKRAEALSQIAAAPKYQIPELAAKFWNVAGLAGSLPMNASAEMIRSAAENMMQQSKMISTHYQHVDGTSFAAPIVASVVAQMLEANPKLTPLAVKNILIATASRIRNAPILRQGYGTLNAAAAVQQAQGEEHVSASHFSAPRIEKENLVFFYHDDSADKVALAGDFNDWNSMALDFRKETEGIWQAEIPLPEQGRYRYKFIINGNQWIDDPGNGMKEPDNYGGFNSVVVIS